MFKRTLSHSFSLLHIDYVKLGKKWNYKNVISPYHRIYYIDEGLGKLSDVRQEFTLEAGYLYFIPSYTLCNLNCVHYLSQYFVQFFEESPDGYSIFGNNRQIIKVKANKIDVINFKRLLQINPMRGINRSDDPKIYENNTYYAEYEELNNKQGFAQFVESQGIILHLISRCSNQINLSKNKNSLKVPVKILETISFIAVNLSNDLSVKSLAFRSNLNSEYFSRLFQKHTGLRPVVYVNNKRIERAKYLIMNGEKSYSKIAEETGFQSTAHFSRTFKKVVGVSPRAYLANR